MMIKVLSWVPQIRKLTVGLRRKCGRSGRITVRHKGGGVSKLFQLSEHNRLLWHTSAVVVSFVIDSRKHAYYAVIFYPRLKLFSAILASAEIVIGDIVEAGEQVAVRSGNSMLLQNIPLNTKIFNIESYPGSGGVFVKTGGNWARIRQHNDITNEVVVEFKRGILKRFSGACMATVGVVALRFVKNSFRRAGVKRRLGRRPSVRGVAMNAVDHPHGGGKGKKSGNAVSMSPWRRLGKGQPTVLKKNHISVI